MVQHHCVTKIIGVDVINGDSQYLPTIISTKDQQQEANMFVACRKVFTEEEDADENGWIAVIPPLLLSKWMMSWGQRPMKKG